MLLNSEQTHICGCVLSLNVGIVLISYWLGSIYIMIAWKESTDKLRPVLRVRILKAESHFHCYCFVFAREKGSAGFQAIPEAQRSERVSISSCCWM